MLVDCSDPLPPRRVIYYPYVPQGLPAAKNAGSGGTGLPGGASASSLASVSGGGAGGQSQGVVQAADGSWEAPYGDYKAIQGSPAAVSAETTKELSEEERQFQEYKKVSERRLERVKGKVSFLDLFFETCDPPGKIPVCSLSIVWCTISLVHLVALPPRVEGVTPVIIIIFRSGATTNAPLSFSGNSTVSRRR